MRILQRRGIFDEHTDSFNTQEGGAHNRPLHRQDIIKNMIEDFANRYVFVPEHEYESYRKWKERGKSAVSFNQLQDPILGTISKRRENVQKDTMENAPMSEAVLDHGQKLEGYLRDIAKAKANATEVKRAETQPLVEALSKVAERPRPNAPATQVEGDRETEVASHQPIVSPEQSRPRTRELDGKSRQTARAGKENNDPMHVWEWSDGLRSAWRP